MNDPYEFAIHQITSNKDNNPNFGTGFVIYRKSSTTYVLTCRHVLDGVGGKEHALVNNNAVVEAIEKSNKSPDDMAILVVKHLSSPVLPLKKAPKTDLPFIVGGFYKLNSKTGRYEIQRVTGITEGPAWQKLKKSEKKVKTWCLNIKSDHTLQPGYSGSPVIDGSDGTVIGMVNMDFPYKKEKGRAVAIETLMDLMDVWPDMPPDLKTALTKKKKPPLHQKKNFTSFLAKLCNRDRHNADFYDTFRKACQDQTCSAYPQFYIIPGGKYECHESFVERMLDTHIKHFAEQKGQEKILRRKPIIVNFPEHEELESLKKRLAQELIFSVNSKYFKEEFSLAAFCSQPQLKGYDIVVINHNIYASKWNKFFGSLVKWYLNEFWSPVNLPKDAPLFIIFICIKYKNSGKSLIQRFNSRRINKKMRKTLDEIKVSVKENCRCLVMKEIGSICQEDIWNWFAKEETPFFDKDVIKDKIEKICLEENFLQMVEAEKWLKKIIKQYDGDNYNKAVWEA